MKNTNENGTRVNLVVETATLTATLNDTVSARDLISKLPYRVRVNRSPVDYCGVLSEPLGSDEAEGQPGWKNGDISYIPGDNYIALFFDGEVDSSSSGYTQHIIGRLDDPAGLVAWPPGSVEVKIERIQTKSAPRS